MGATGCYHLATDESIHLFAVDMSAEAFSLHPLHQVVSSNRPVGGLTAPHLKSSHISIIKSGVSHGHILQINLLNMINNNY